MAKLSRKEARDILFGLLFETEFKAGENPTEIYELACADRDIPADSYIKNTFFDFKALKDTVSALILFSIVLSFKLTFCGFTP